MKKVFTLFSIILMLLLSFSISAEEIPSFYASRPQANNLSATAQQRYCSTVYPNLSSYDFVAYYTVDHSWLAANTLLYGTATYGGSSWTFEGFAWNDFESSPEEISISRGFSWDDNSDYIYRFLDYDDYDNTSVLNVCGSIIPPSVSAPDLVLPTPTVPNITINNFQNEYLNANSSPFISGGSLNYFKLDHYNIYSVYQTKETDEFFNNRNDIYYIYQTNSNGSGHYIFAVYDYTELLVFAPNMSVSSSSFTLTYSEYNNIKYSFGSSNGLIQRDINKFEFKYVDESFSDFYGYDQLPFNNSSDNKNKVEYLGTRVQMLNGGASSMSTQLAINSTTIDVNFTFIITDTENAYQNAQSMNNQTIINNNMNNNFTNLDNTLQHGNSLTQGSKNNLDIANNGLNSTINQYNQLDQQANQDLIDDLNAIDLNDFAINGLIQLSNSSNFVRTQFNNLTANNPIGTSVGFALVVGLSLLLLAKRL